MWRFIWLLWMSKNWLKYSLIYIVMTAGGLWHILGIFSTAMRLLAAPLMIGLSIYLLLQVYLNHKTYLNGNSGAVHARKDVRFWLGSISVIISGFFVEWIGLKTGKIFGNYFYGSILQPSISGVPLAMGFAWLLILLCSAGLAQKIILILNARRNWLFLLLIAIFMIVFDLFMEPAAVKLHYWQWVGEIPLQNYIAWGVIGYVFAIYAYLFGIFSVPLDDATVHVYFAQLIYFLLVQLA